MIHFSHSQHPIASCVVYFCPLCTRKSRELYGRVKRIKKQGKSGNNRKRRRNKKTLYTESTSEQHTQAHDDTSCIYTHRQEHHISTTHKNFPSFFLYSHFHSHVSPVLVLVPRRRPPPLVHVH